MQHIHILGICGTFMGGVAILARQLGYQVTGSDHNIYPPMSTMLQEQGIEIIEGFDPAQLNPRPDLVVIGNAMSRGNPCVEAVLAQGLPYRSGPQWLHDVLLEKRWVLAVAGTHGKTTTSSMLTWILDYCGYQPGFLVGGVLGNFGISARLGNSDFFVIEADEYDSAFFDKRSKFVHYQPKTLVLNNLEFDHADIFDDLAAIERQFHHLVRTVPNIGRIIAPQQDAALQRVLARGCWSEVETTGDQGQWQVLKRMPDGREFDVWLQGKKQGSVSWSLVGDHNLNNALMAIAAARHVGVTPAQACEALGHFINSKRRLELKGQAAGVSVYDDFAHHPTAIALTLSGLKNTLTQQGNQAGRILAVVEPRSATMKLGVHQASLARSLAQADAVYWYQPMPLTWSVEEVAQQCSSPSTVITDVNQLAQQLAQDASAGDVVLIMSNGSVDGLHDKLLVQLNAKTEN